MKIVMEESLAAMPKFILEVKDGVILFFNEHAPYPDGWYWHTDAGPFIGPFESIDDATEAAVIASDPGVEIKIFDTRGRIAKLPARSSWRSGAEASERSNAQSRAQPGAR